MIQTLLISLCALAAVALAQNTSNATEYSPYPLKSHFSSWYPQAGQYLPNVLVDHCMDNYSIYLGNKTVPPADGNLSSPAYDQHGDYIYRDSCHNCRILPVVDCILTNWREADKANMASAAVLLGLIPTILGVIGPSTIDTGLLALRRPVLAFFLAASSLPAISVPPAEYPAPRKILIGHTNALYERSTLVLAAISIVEYLLTFASVANLCVVSYQLGVRTICSFAQETTFMPALYAFLALVVRGAGAIAVARRYQFTSASKRDTLGSWLVQEVTPCCNHMPVEIKERKESDDWLFVLFAWLTWAGTALLTIFGTLVLSSTIFLLTQDALIVVVQYLGSTFIARFVLTYELSCLRKQPASDPVLDETGSESDDVELHNLRRTRHSASKTPLANH